MKDCTPLAVLLVAASALTLGAQQTPVAPPAGAQSYTVFLRGNAIGREDVTVVRQADGWIVRGTNSLGPPLDVVTRNAEIHYSADWQPMRMVIDGSSRGQPVTITTTFAGGKAENQIVVAGETTTDVDDVSADAVVLPNGFLGSYAALSRRLVGVQTGATLRGYIAPQAELPMRVAGVFAERIETPRAAIAATRYALIVTNQAPAGELSVSVWTDASGNLLRFSVPAQMLEVAREDIASAATRTTAFSIPGDESVRIPASGFSLAASISKPRDASGRLPAIVLVGGSNATDRDGYLGGIPVIGHIARDLVNAGFLVVRYDRRGVGQSGGRPENATINDYAEDVRAIVSWLDKRRPDVDKRRIGVVGYDDGAWVAMRAAAREKKIKALVLVGGAGTPGAEFVLEQQRDALERAKTPAAERDEKIALQKLIHAAVLGDGSWDDVPDELRRAADSAWFQSLLAFDPARVMKDVRQPVLVVQGALDMQVKPHHGEKLAELARARRRQVDSELVTVPAVNHLLVPATGNDADPSPAMAAGQQVSSIATSAIATWMTRILG